VLRVATIADDTEAEGPGRRWAIWLQGCPIRCAGCCNPEMFDERGGTARPLADLSRSHRPAPPPGSLRPPAGSGSR
jgi:anaerobic ribonucleoside-triphosphate reductase activating protein